MLGNPISRTLSFNIRILCAVLMCLATVSRANIAEKKSYIEAINRNIEQLEEEISVKQSTVTRNKANAKRYSIL